MEKYKTIPTFYQTPLLTTEDLKDSILVHGPGNVSPWNKKKRLKLVNNLAILVEQLHVVGIDEIFIDGSFVEDKTSPGDIDGYFIANPLNTPRYN